MCLNEVDKRMSEHMLGWCCNFKKKMFQKVIWVPFALCSPFDALIDCH